MPLMKLHVLNANGALTRLRPWLTRRLRGAHRRAAAALDLPPLDVVIRAGTQVIPEKGHVGFAPAGGVIYITVDPSNSALLADHHASLQRMMAHELHHAARWAAMAPGRSLGAALVAEGLAGQFVQQLYGPPREPWEALDTEALAPHLAAARALWDSTDYDHPAWFFGTGALPRWLGYTLGFQLVARHLANHPDACAAGLVAAPDTAFRPLLDQI